MRRDRAIRDTKNDIQDLCNYAKTCHTSSWRLDKGSPSNNLGKSVLSHFLNFSTVGDPCRPKQARIVEVSFQSDGDDQLICANEDERELSCVFTDLQQPSRV